MLLIIQWSYGVLVWEVLSGGIEPYMDVDPWDVRTYLDGGRRLSKPNICPSDM